jgi:hypothetical protein
MPPRPNVKMRPGRFLLYNPSRVLYEGLGTQSKQCSIIRRGQPFCTYRMVPEPSTSVPRGMNNRSQRGSSTAQRRRQRVRRGNRRSEVHGGDLFRPGGSSLSCFARMLFGRGLVRPFLCSPDFVFARVRFRPCLFLPRYCFVFVSPGRVFFRGLFVVFICVVSSVVLCFVRLLFCFVFMTCCSLLLVELR